MGRHYAPSPVQAVLRPGLGFAVQADCEAKLAKLSLERRAALDIGSGCTKLVVADVDVATGRCERVLTTQEVPVLYGVALRRAADGRLSEAVQAEGLKELGRLVQEAKALGCQHFAAVATEAFRRAPNGGEFVSRVKKEVGLSIRIIDQSLEARLGFSTAAAVSDVSAWDLISWDCGGASYQLVTAGADAAAGELSTHCGALGDAAATAALVELQGRSFAKTPSPNPVSLDEAEALVARLKERMPEPPAWLRGARGVVAIGGRNSMFALLADMLRAGAEANTKEDLPPRVLPGAEAEQCGGKGPRPDLPSTCTVTPAAAWAAVRASVDLSEQELARRWCWRPNTDPPSMVLPKLCLIIASLEKFQVESAQWKRTVGCCPGVLMADPVAA